MKEIKTLSDKHSQKEKDRQEKERIISAKESQLKQLQTEYKQFKTLIETMEAKERQLSQDIQAIIYTNTTSAVQNQKGVTTIFQKAQNLEQSLQTLKRENKGLRDKLENTEAGMTDFIREMESLMDRHELKEALNEMLRSDQQYPLRDRGRNDEDAGGSTGGSMRRNK